MEVKSWVVIYFHEPEFMMHPTKCSVVYRHRPRKGTQIHFCHDVMILICTVILRAQI